MKTKSWNKFDIYKSGLMEKEQNAVNALRAASLPILSAYVKDRLDRGVSITVIIKWLRRAADILEKFE